MTVVVVVTCLLLTVSSSGTYVTQPRSLFNMGGLSRELHVLPRLSKNMSNISLKDVRKSIKDRPVGFHSHIKNNRDASDSISITIVVSHCSMSLEWLAPIINDIKDRNSNFSIDKTYIYSKCNEKVIDAPSNSVVVNLPNVGRSEHTFLFFITQMKLTEGVVLFLKDTQNVRSESQHGVAFSVIDYPTMVEQSLSPSHFSCRQYIDNNATGLSNDVITKVLLSWSARFFRQRTRSLPTDMQAPFSNYARMRQWTDQLKLKFPKPLTTVCHGGSFAVSVERIRSVDRNIWVALRHSLARGNNIQERFFMERTWAAILANPPQNSRKIRVKCFKNDICGYIGNIVDSWSVLNSSTICGKGMAIYYKKGYVNQCTIKTSSA